MGGRQPPRGVVVVAVTGAALWAWRGIVAWFLVEIGGLVVLAAQEVALRMSVRRRCR
jgi:hypothetical protein